MAKITLDFNDEQRAFEISRQLDVLRVSDESGTSELRLVHHEDGIFVLELISPDGQRRLLHVAGAASGDQRQLWVEGQTFSYQRVTPRDTRAAREGSLSAAIPAVVTELLVTEGTAVSTGQKLILLESMKMVIPIQAPYDGFVSAIHCAVGDAVQAGVPLLELSKVEEKE